MEFSSEKYAEIRRLEADINRLEKEIEAEKERLIAEKISHGWKKFEFHSSYYGSHPEYGEDDKNTIFIFCPTVDISRWQG